MRGIFNDAYAILYSVVLYKSICCGYSFEFKQEVSISSACRYPFPREVTTAFLILNYNLNVHLLQTDVQTDIWIYINGNVKVAVTLSK